MPVIKLSSLTAVEKLYPEIRESMTVNDVMVLNIRNISTITSMSVEFEVVARELQRELIEHTVVRGKLYGQPKSGLASFFTQKKSRKHDQEAEGSHFNKTCHVKVPYLSQLSDSEPTN